MKKRNGLNQLDQNTVFGKMYVNISRCGTHRYDQNPGKASAVESPGSVSLTGFVVDLLLSVSSSFSISAGILSYLSIGPVKALLRANGIELTAFFFLAF